MRKVKNIEKKKHKVKPLKDNDTKVQTVRKTKRFRLNGNRVSHVTRRICVTKSWDV